MPMTNKLPKFLDNHKICIICEGNEEYEYLNRLKNLKVWNEQYDISLVNAGGNGNIPARYQDRYQNGADEQNVFNVTVNKGQAIIANDNASVTATANIGADASELEKLIAAVRDKIGTIASDEDKEAASESLEVIEAEVVSEKPKKSMIKTAMATLQAIKGTVEFGSAAAALIQFIGPMLP